MRTGFETPAGWKQQVVVAQKIKPGGAGTRSQGTIIEANEEHGKIKLDDGSIVFYEISEFQAPKNTPNGYRNLSKGNNVEFDLSHEQGQNCAKRITRRIKGRVLEWSREKGFGRIACNEPCKRIPPLYMHQSEIACIEDWRSMKERRLEDSYPEGDMVEFEIANVLLYGNEIVEANNVRIVSPSE